MNTHRPLPALAALALLAALAGCDRNEGQTAGQQLDSVLERTRQAANDVKEGGREAAQDAREAGSTVMGAGSAPQRERKDDTSLGTKVDDAGITAKVKAGLGADKDLSATKIEVDTREGVVTLKGEVANAAARARAGEIARNVKNVQRIDNQLTVKAG